MNDQNLVQPNGIKQADIFDGILKPAQVSLFFANISILVICYAEGKEIDFQFQKCLTMLFVCWNKNKSR